MPYSSGVASVTASAVKICTVGPQGVLVQNLGAVVITLGGSGVTAGQGVALPGSPVPSQPAVAATGVAVQNVNAYPVQAVISLNGATITNVSVNGITVGTTAGTYTVPAFGSISIAYTVATPTWVWSNASPAPAPVFVPGGQPQVSGIVPAGPTVTEDLYGIGAAAGPTNVAFTVPG